MSKLKTKYQCEICEKNFSQKIDLTRHKSKKNACIPIKIIEEINRQNEELKKVIIEKQKELQLLSNNLGISLTYDEIKTLENDLCNNFVYKQLKTNPKYPNYDKYINNLRIVILYADDFMKHIDKFISKNKEMIINRLQAGTNYSESLSTFSFTNHNELTVANSFLKVLLQKYNKDTIIDNRPIRISLYPQSNNYNNDYKISILCWINNYFTNEHNYIEYAIQHNINLPEIDLINNKKNEFNSYLLATNKIKQILLEKKEEYEKKLLNENSIVFYNHEMQLLNNNLCNNELTKYIDSSFNEYMKRLKEKINLEKLDMIYENFGKLIIDINHWTSNDRINIFYCIKQI